MARRYIRDKIGRFSAKGGGISGSRGAGLGVNRGGAALEQTAGAAWRKAEAIGSVARRNFRAASTVQELGVKNRETKRYRKASPKAKEVAAKRVEMAQKRQAVATKIWREGRQQGLRRGKNVEKLTTKRRYAIPK